MSEKSILIAGASGHGLVCAEIACLMGYGKVEFVDDDPCAAARFPWPVVGSVASARPADYDACFVAIGSSSARARIQGVIEGMGGRVTVLCHPSAVVSQTAEIGMGSVLMAGAVVNAYARVGEGCIVNTCASVDHECTVGNWCHVAVGAHLAGSVVLGQSTWVGAGAIVSNDISVCAGCMIGAGAVVVGDINVPGTYIGVPARLLRGGVLG